MTKNTQSSFPQTKNAQAHYYYYHYAHDLAVTAYPLWLPNAAHVWDRFSRFSRGGVDSDSGTGGKWPTCVGQPIG